MRLTHRKGGGLGRTEREREGERNGGRAECPAAKSHDIVLIRRHNRSAFNQNWARGSLSLSLSLSLAVAAAES